jgi:hypothetical protein
VLHTVVRFGIPPTESIPAECQFADAFEADGTTLLLPTCAWHEAVLPPFEPAHVHIHGPEPETADAVPILQRLVAGALVRSVLLAEPHMPFTGVFAASAEPLATAVNSSRHCTPRPKNIIVSARAQQSAYRVCRFSLISCECPIGSVTR